ncbi:MAG: TRAP transporter large permease subunit, partial [Candidatus Devosia euplotis]|nr:TRAP transporter large permease subunit [Candidatus Devosia euplotis]
AIIVLTPILLPVILLYGVDPIHFGIIMTINLAIGFATPPVGANIFIATQLTKLDLIDTCKGLPASLSLLILGLAIVTHIPAVALWLPSMF